MRKKKTQEEVGKRKRWSSPEKLRIVLAGRSYYYLAFVDEYSRYIVHWELLSNMEGHSLSLVGQQSLETLPHDAHGQLLVKPEIRSDNGSGYISKEFHGVLEHYGLTHVKIRPHCPEEKDYAALHLCAGARRCGIVVSR